VSDQKKEDQFAVFAEADGQSKPLIMTDLTFARLMDEVVLPYQTDEPFFIDGASLKKQSLKRLKIIKQEDFFNTTYHDLHHAMRWRGSDIKTRQLYAEQYHIRLEALLRESGVDVTAQIIKAFDRTIKPSLKDYLPKREELIKAALTIFVESMKALNK
jgi:hypothetical protein